MLSGGGCQLQLPVWWDENRGAYKDSPCANQTAQRQKTPFMFQCVNNHTSVCFKFCVCHWSCFKVCFLQRPLFLCFAQTSIILLINWDRIKVKRAEYISEENTCIFFQFIHTDGHFSTELFGLVYKNEEFQTQLSGACIIIGILMEAEFLNMVPQRTSFRIHHVPYSPLICSNRIQLSCIDFYKLYRFTIHS